MRRGKCRTRRELVRYAAAIGALATLGGPRRANAQRRDEFSKEIIGKQREIDAQLKRVKAAKAPLTREETAKLLAEEQISRLEFGKLLNSIPQKDVETYFLAEQRNLAKLFSIHSVPLVPKVSEIAVQNTDLKTKAITPPLPKPSINQAFENFSRIG